MDKQVTALAQPTGLTYIQDAVSKDEETSLLQTIDKLPWDNVLKRRVQHYGWKYNYSTRSVSKKDALGPLPSWAEAIAKRLAHVGPFTQIPDQLIVNEYLPGQGIGAHIDAKIFGPTVAMLTLGSHTVMTFRDKDKKKDPVDLLMEPRSLAVITGNARHQWTHEIERRKIDVYNKKRMKRSRRVSLTFRTMSIKSQ